jgi:hypothetical protein
VNPGKLLARFRAEKLRADDLAKVAALRESITHARARRRAAMTIATRKCREHRKLVQLQIVARRKAEAERLKQEILQLRRRARAQCQARKHRIRQAGGATLAKERALLREERALQAQLKRLHAAAVMKRRKHAASTRERKQESDDYVRSNLPAELRPVFERVRSQIKGGARTTRTEAFLEWAESHPEEVLQYQAHDADREVAQLVAQHYATSARLKKGKRHYRAIAAGEVPF